MQSSWAASNLGVDTCLLTISEGRLQSFRDIDDDDALYWLETTVTAAFVI